MRSYIDMLRLADEASVATRIAGLAERLSSIGDRAALATGILEKQAAWGAAFEHAERAALATGTLEKQTAWGAAFEHAERTALATGTLEKQTAWGAAFEHAERAALATGILEKQTAWGAAFEHAERAALATGILEKQTAWGSAFEHAERAALATGILEKQTAWGSAFEHAERAALATGILEKQTAWGSAFEHAERAALATGILEKQAAWGSAFEHAERGSINRAVDVLLRTTTARGSHDSHVRIVRTPKFDARNLLDPASKKHEIARSVDNIVKAIESLAHDVTNAQKERADDTRDERTEHVGATAERSTRDVRTNRLWVPRQRSSVWTPRRTRDHNPQEDLEPVPVFCGNARVDEQHREKLMNHLCMLRHQRIIRTWHEGEVLGGEDLKEQVWRNLELARIILLLISAEYLNELYERDMMNKIEKCHSSAVIVPILVSPVDMTDDDALIARLPPFPSNRKEITKWQDRDEAWVDVARGIRSHVASIRHASKTLFS
ncbi:hypothetical protein [Sorangium atrum]|uniref:TIR domain-containing protein n=1 Tax=Sorangium atrum TaxID=2995308 RepID=A0ABT5BYX2_9BACT|nr:hypothetical protein [Sorangium aterium]MDC0678734.1 hypothetical protein [Sorangium aterium]